MFRLKKWLKKYGLVAATGVTFLLLIFHSNYVFRRDYTSEIENYQIEFRKKTKELDAFLAYKKAHFSEKNISILNRKELQENNFYLHIFRNDSLLFWNTNQLPISRFADIHFPSEGILHLQNGWYYAKILRVNKCQIVASFLIKKDYSYENSTLKNDYNPTLNLPFRASIILEKDNAFPIYSSSKKFLFAWYIYPNQPIPSWNSDLLFLTFILFLFVSFFALYRFAKKLPKVWFWSLFFLVWVVRFASLKWHWFVFIYGITAFEKSMYSSYSWLPNFGEFVIHCFVVIWSFFAIIDYLKRFNNENRKNLVAYIAFLSSIISSFFLSEIYRTLIKNSSIPLKIENLFELNFYSFLTFFFMGVLFYSLFHLFRKSIFYLRQSSVSKFQIYTIWLVVSSLCFWMDMTYGNQQPFLLFLLLFISLMILFFTIRLDGKVQFGYGMFVLFLFAFFVALNLEIFHTKKENVEREILASRLASDKDVKTENEFLTLAKNLESDSYLKRVLQSSVILGISEFKDNMERRFFNHFWERYDVEFYLYNTQKISRINYANFQTNNLSNLESIISRHSLPSEKDNRLYYIKDYTSQYSYIIRFEVYESNVCMGTLYCALKSKKIPEKIGFPRILVSDEAHVLAPLENYSIAKYYNGKLVSHNGTFSYPSNDFGLSFTKKIQSGYSNIGGYNHYLLKKNERDLIVLSLENHSALHWFTTCSYLFSFYGLFLVIPLFFKKRDDVLYIKQFSLALRIQLVVIGIVFTALLVFGLGSGSFITDQYREYTNDGIREKIRSLERDLKQKYGTKQNLTIEQNGEALEYVLQKLSSVFMTDINLYDKQGFLLAGSRPKLFNIGLLSEQINPTALFELNQYKRSEYIHEETIGNLQFLSAYLPLYNNEGELLAYINLQHFGQQQGVEFQIKQFLEAIMNVSILLLALSVIFALFISTWVTSPLRRLQESLSGIQLGKFNKPIAYNAKDEIGTLVEDYNRKLEELAFTTQKLAQSERESAWREMAKQVAHEIKNPLTPMKLSLQQLQRVYSPENPLSKEQLNKISNSLIEQIDALAKIANEFSNFAKLPKATIQELHLNTLIQTIVALYQQEDKVKITFTSTVMDAYIQGDKDLLVRVFNNLITNAIQSVPADRIGEIQMALEEKQDSYLLAIRDNGSGISEDVKASIFVPYFTTKSTGTGLGLAMTKQIIEQHHGKIWFETKINEGTTFFVELERV